MPSYFDAGSSVCQPCHYTCLTCSAALDTSCSTCGPTRTPAGGSCPCVNGLFNAGVSTCQACHTSCGLCGDGGVCSTCTSLNTFLNGTVCSACHGSCASCSGATSRSCMSCSPPLTMINGKCRCPDDQLLNSTFQCQTCGNSILRTSCLDPTNPVSSAFIACVAVAGVVFVGGLYFGSIIGIELAHLLQMVFFAVSLVSIPPDPMVPAAQLSEFVNGFIYRNGAALSSPAQISAMNYSLSVSENCNIMILMEFLIGVVGLCFFLFSPERQAPENNENPPEPSTLSKIAKFMIYSLLLDWALFMTLGFSFAWGLYMRRVDPRINTLTESVSNIAAILVGVLIQVAICYNIIKKNINEEKQKAIKSGTEEGYKQAPYHPVILALHRMLLGLLMGLLYDVSYRAVVILILQLAYVIFYCVRNPFREKYMIVRQLLVEFTIVLIIIIAMIYEYSSAGDEPAWMWVEWAAVIGCIGCSIGCFVKERIANRSLVQLEDNSHIQPTMEDMAVELRNNTSGIGQASSAGPRFDEKPETAAVGKPQVINLDVVEEGIEPHNTVYLQQATGPGQGKIPIDMVQFEKNLQANQ